MVRFPSLRPARTFRQVSLACVLLCLPTSFLRAQYQSFWERFDIERNAAVSLAYDSNIGSSRFEFADTILSGSVSVAASQQFRYFRLGAELTGLAAHYFDYSQLDYQNVFLDWIIDAGEDLGGRRLQYSVGFNIAEETQTSQELQGQGTARIYNADADVTYLLSRSISIGAGIGYNKREPQGNVRRIRPDGTVDETRELFGSSSVQFSGYANWEQSDNLRYRLTASRRNQLSDRIAGREGTIDSIDLSAIGNLTAKLTGRVGVGYEARSLDSGNDDSAPTYNASLSWAIDDLSQLTVAGNRRFDASLNGGSSFTSTLSVSYNRRLSRLMSFFVRVSLQKASYEFEDDPELDDDFIPSNREDVEAESYGASFGITRQITSWSAASFNLSWEDRDSEFINGQQGSSYRASLTYQMTF